MATVIRAYENISAERFAQLDLEADRILGMNLQGNTGQTSAHGISLAWDYDPVGLTLSFTLLGKPFYVPVGVIESHLDQLVNGDSH